MLIWGGLDANVFTNTGGRYDPSTNQWLTLSQLNAPTARVGHTALWTGKEMLIWGGTSDGMSGLNTGARYDPSTDLWVSTSVQLNTPSPRRYHAAVWTGTNMLVVGGEFPLGTDVYSYCGCASAVSSYRDFDGDGYGNADDTQVTCGSVPPSGYVTTPGDCDDHEFSVNPGHAETCDGLDNDCDSQVDEDPSGTDSDADGVHNACDNCRFAFNPDQLDADGDLVGNACDNCVTVSNPGQQDLDSDQRGDACDNCPAAYNPFQDDSDADRRGDACDNCVFDFNPPQSDFDHDGQGDRCDLNDGLIYVFSTDPGYVEWQDEIGPSSWNVYEGSLAVLRSTGVYSQAPGSNSLAQRSCHVSQDYVEDFEVVPPGACKFAFVTGITGGLEGSLGTNSVGATRPNANPCP
jgi:hypothetical protein